MPLTLRASVDGWAGTSTIVAPVEDPRIIGVVTIASNFRMQACRVVCRKSGTLMALNYWAGTVITGTVRGSIYDVGATTSAVRTRVFNGGVVTPPGTSRWVSLGDPAIAVSAGQHLDFVIQMDTATAEYGRATPFTVGAQGTLPVPNVGGCLYKLSWVNTAPIDLTAPTTIAEGTAAASASLPVLIAQIV